MSKISDNPLYKYSPVNGEIAAELKKIAGEKYVIFNDPEKLEPFSHDETPGKEWASMPEAVVRPANVEEISKILKLANEKMIPITPRGAGSGLSGGAVPIYGGIVISCDRMNKIIELDKENMMIVAEAGVIANDINEHIREHNLFYAGYPMSMETCYIGGNVAENAGGGKAVKYGVTSRYVLGLEIVTPTGEIVELGGKLLKDVTGYNMVQLMVGSEGTLGFITKVILKLIPLPRYQVDLLCLFKSSEDAIAAVPKIITKSGITPTSIEYMDKEAVHESCRYLNENIPYQNAGAMLLITVDGAEKEPVENDYERIGELCMQEGAFEVYVADNPTTSERIWKIRRNIPEAFSVFSKKQCGEDIVVPPASIPQIVSEFKKLSTKYGLRIPSYGHAGDGNLHSRIIAPPDWTDDRWKDTLPQVLNELYTLVKQLGGKISGEHGIGHKRKKYMKNVVSEEYINMLKAVKKALDPNNIMNPGKIFE
jgi:glycolate oxidase